MARPVAVLLLLTLALAPAAVAAPGWDAGESPLAGWRGALSGVFDWLFSWIPGIRSVTANTGAYIDPIGVAAPPAGVRSVTANHDAFIDPIGIRSTPRRNGAYIEPSGLRTPEQQRGPATR